MAHGGDAGIAAARRKFSPARPKSRMAFSLVEVLAAIAIIGIITFLAIPGIVRVKEDSERTLAIARAEALNMAMASYLQVHGAPVATANWDDTTSNAERYTLVRPYLAFAPADVANYLPTGYTATLPVDLLPLQKAALAGPEGSITY